ncbi:MAG: DUF4296 domain-containing protein [Flavobacteriales bacterium]
MKRPSVIPLLLAMLLLASCAEQEPQPPSDLIGRDAFVQVLADVQLIEARINHEMVVDQRTDSPAQRYYEELYTERKITKDQYGRTYQWYAEHPERMKAVYEDVLTELGRRKEKGE